VGAGRYGEGAGWIGNGFAVWHKVIESREKYYCADAVQEVVAVSVEQLNWLLDATMCASAASDAASCT